MSTPLGPGVVPSLVASRVLRLGPRVVPEPEADGRETTRDVTWVRLEGRSTKVFGSGFSFCVLNEGTSSKGLLHG